MRIAVGARNLVRPVSGIGRYVAASVAALAGRGARLHLLLPAPMHDDFAALARLENVTVDCSNSAGLAGRLAWSRFVLPGKINALRPDVFWGPAHRLPGGLDPQIARVLTVHDLVWRMAPETMLWYRRLGEAWLMPSAVRAADHVVAVSRTTETSVRDFFGIAPSSISTVYPAIPRLPAPIGAETFPALGITGPYCLFVGTREPRKNLDRAVAAFLSLPPEVRGDFQFVIAGSHGWKNTTSGADAGSAPGPVTVTGPVDDATLAGLYAHCAFVVMPSTYEGFGMPVIEAQHFGKPVLTSRATSMEEIGGDTLTLVEPTDTASIAAGMATLMRSSFSHDAADRARANAARFSSAAAATGLFAAFDRAIDSRRRR